MSCVLSLVLQLVKLVYLVWHLMCLVSCDSPVYVLSLVIRLCMSCVWPVCLLSLVSPVHVLYLLCRRACLVSYVTPVRVLFLLCHLCMSCTLCVSCAYLVFFVSPVHVLCIAFVYLAVASSSAGKSRCVVSKGEVSIPVRSGQFPLLKVWFIMRYWFFGWLSGVFSGYSGLFPSIWKRSIHLYVKSCLITVITGRETYFCK